MNNIDQNLLFCQIPDPQKLPEVTMPATFTALPLLIYLKLSATPIRPLQSSAPFLRIKKINKLKKFLQIKPPIKKTAAITPPF